MRLAVLIALAAVLALGACGGEPDRGTTEFVPAAGADTPPAAPQGSSYDLSGSEWLKLPAARRLLAAEDFVADHPGECENADGRAAAASVVRDWADVSLGTDYPLNAPIAELLAEGCAAALQSGEQDLAPG